MLPHDERENGPLGTDGHEELYVVLRGRAVFRIGRHEVDAGAGTLVFVRDPALVRSAVARDAGTAIIGVGAPAGARGPARSVGGPGGRSRRAG